MPLLTTKGLILRETKYKEADKILTILTEGEGKLTVKARGALRKGCKYAASTEALTYSEFTLFGSKGRWSINEAQILEQFLPLRRELSGLALGTYFAELTEAAADEDKPDPELLRLCLNALYALSRGLYAKEHIKAVFELRLMCLSGYEPDLNNLPACGITGVSDSELAAIGYIRAADLKKIFSFELKDENARKRLYTACERYALTHLDRKFGSLDYYKSVKQR